MIVNIYETLPKNSIVTHMYDYSWCINQIEIIMKTLDWQNKIKNK